MTEGNGDIRELPKGWCWIELEEISDFKNGINFKKEQKGGQGILTVDVLNMYSQGVNVALDKLYRVDIKIDRERILKYGDILFVRSSVKREGVGWAALFKESSEPITFCGFIIRARISSVEIHPEYLTYYLRTHSAREKIVASSNQVTITNINQDSLGKIRIPLCSAKEQERIVEKIEELFSDVDKGVESLKTAQKQLKVYRQAVLKWAFEGKLTKAWRKQHSSTLKTGEALLAQIKTERETRYQQRLVEWETAVKEWEAIGKVGRKPTKPQNSKDFSLLTQSENSNLPKLSDGWCWERAGNIFSEINNGHTPTKEKLNPSNGEVPFLKVYNLTHNGSLDFKDLTFIARETHKLELTRSIVYPDDVLFNIVGPPLGKVSLVPPEYSEYNINQAVVVFRPNKRYLAKFLMYALLTRSVITWILSTGKATAGQTNLKVSSCREQPLPVCSTEEQERIVEEIESRLSICDQLEATIIENLQKAEALRQSILKQAFEGKLVPQDPNDEPAEKLLEQIRLERQEKQPPQTSKQLKIKGI